MAFGTWIREEREKAGVSLKDLSRRINISTPYWSRIERGYEKAPKDSLIIAACEQLGADRAINYRSSDFVAEVLKLTDGRGVNVVLDMVAGEYLDREVKCLADEGRISVIATLGGAKSTVFMPEVTRKRATITGSTLRPRSVAFKGAVATALRERIWPLVESGAIKPVIFKTFPLEQAAQAHALMESSQHIGKIVLTMS